MKTTFVFRTDWIANKISAKNGQVDFDTVTLRLPIGLVRCASNRSSPSLLATFFQKELTEGEVQRYDLLHYGPRSRQFRWFLIGVVLTCRDSNTSPSRARKIQRIICMNNTWFLIWERELLQTFHRLLRRLVHRGVDGQMTLRQHVQEKR